MVSCYCFQFRAHEITQAPPPSSRVSGRAPRRGAGIFDSNTIGGFQAESRGRVPKFRIRSTPETTGDAALAAVAPDIPVARVGWFHHERSGAHSRRGAWNS